MTDKQLVVYLRWLGDHASFEPDMHHAAADRIEKLEVALGMSEKRFATLKDAWDTLRRRDMPPLYGSAALAGEKKND